MNDLHDWQEGIVTSTDCEEEKVDVCIFQGKGGHEHLSDHQFLYPPGGNKHGEVEG